MTTTTPQPNDEGPDLRGVFAVRPESFPADAGYGGPGEDVPAPGIRPQEPVIEHAEGTGAAEHAVDADADAREGETRDRRDVRDVWDVWDTDGTADTEPRREPVAASVAAPLFAADPDFDPDPDPDPDPEPVTAADLAPDSDLGLDPAPDSDSDSDSDPASASASATSPADTALLAPWELPVPLTLGGGADRATDSGPRETGLRETDAHETGPRETGFRETSPRETASGTAPGPRTGAALADGGRPPRWSPLIVGESTHEIPVHLLFRDEADRPDAGTGRPAMPRPTVIGRRWGSGEQPRVRERPPVPVPVPVVPARAAPSGDPKLAERPGPVLPGWAAVLTGCAALLACVAVAWWCGALPDAVTGAFRLPSRPYHGVGVGTWALLALGATVALLAFGGLGRGRVGHAWVLTLFGDYRGSVRRTGLLWVSPLLLRRGVDVRLRHWRSEPMPAVDSNGTALRVVVLVVWRVRDTVRAALGVQDHEEYLREQVEAAMARVLSQLPADAFHDEAPTLRNAEAVGDALTRMLAAECRPVGVDVFSAQPTRIEYAPEIAAAIQRSRIAAIDAKHRDSVLTSVVDAVDDTVSRLTSRGLVELDDYERKALVKDLTVAFYTGRQGVGERL
ncbi:SPFH domain-containing protein [Streptomyces sp. NBC_01429]|uniref:SPFH domain-containing protein n=1 Tax=Streptomyces sp. NBC_01429 TaxID=2903862 RepID=UPI002E27D4CA|nr:SPFH domain-containing protein [Streptomyces sp. NBC_01429]